MAGNAERSAFTSAARAGARRPAVGPLLYDLASGRLAVGLGGLDPSLALARVLPGAAMIAGGAGALALTRIATHALHLRRVAAALLRVGGERMPGGEQSGPRGRDQCSSNLLVHDVLLFSPVLSTSGAPHARRAVAVEYAAATRLDASATCRCSRPPRQRRGSQIPEPFSS